MAGPGDVPTILKLGNWPKASSYRGSKPGRNEGEGGSPHLLLCLPLPGSLPCLRQLWPLEEESFFWLLSWLCKNLGTLLSIL